MTSKITSESSAVMKHCATFVAVVVVVVIVAVFVFFFVKKAINTKFIYEFGN